MPLSHVTNIDVCKHKDHKKFEKLDKYLPCAYEYALNPPLEDDLKNLDENDRSMMDRCLETAIQLLQNDLIDLRSNEWDIHLRKIYKNDLFSYF